MNKREKLNRPESEPKVNYVSLDLIRHGKTAYVEEFGEGKGKVRDLTEEGETKIREQAEKIADSIDSEREIVVLWGSPAWRAQGSEEIIREVFEKRGIVIHEDQEIPTMRHFDRTKGALDDLWQEYGARGIPFDAAYSRDPALQVPNPRFETSREVKIRGARFINWIDYLARHAELGEKKLRLVSVSHFEIINPIMEDIFGHKVEEGAGIKNAEDLHIDFAFDKPSGKMKISAEFRGVRKDNIVFDKKERKFVIEK